MPQLETIYPSFTYRTSADLKDWIIRANAYGYVTKSQGKAILQKLTPMLPVTASLTVRSNKGVIYMEANNTLFRVGQRGNVIDKPWNPNPRKASRNPWAD
jgi:hypothetical protein